MRRIFTIATALLVGLAACGDDPAGPNGDGNGNGNGGPPNGTMTAQIDGQAWSAINIIAQYDGDLLVVGGADANVTAIGIGVQVVGTGTYVIGTDISANGTVTQDGEMVWLAGLTVGSGSITVTSISAVGAVGTFAFVAEPSVGGATGTRVVTNGTFNVTF